jgi:hypothetical protein
VRDLTGGSRLPFRIRPGAPTSSIDIGANGNVGVGIPATGSVQPLHVKRSDGSARIEVEEASSTPATRTLADLVNNGPGVLRFTNTDTGGTDWTAGGANASDFVVKPDGSSFAPLTVNPAGDVGAAGALTQGADPAAAENAAPVDGDALLAALRTLPLATREYTADPSNARHLWPTAAEFSSAFGLGQGASSIAPGDMAGVALAAVKALDARVSAIAGTPGAQGSDGPQGAQGPQGERGPVGPPGPAGALPASVEKRVKALEARNKRLSKSVSRLQKSVRRLAKKG